MDPKRFRSKTGPEAIIQREFIEYVQQRGWGVQRMVGGMYQYGIPDLYIFHKDHGQRWLDLKNPVKYSWTKAQRVTWPYWASMGIGIWIIVAATEEEYDKLFAPPNVMDYWKESYRVASKEEILRDVYEE